MAAVERTEFEFTNVEKQTRAFLQYYHQIELTPEQERMKTEALAKLPAPCCDDRTAATCCGDAVSIKASSSRALEMLQFWQKRQPRLQPAVPKESTPEPGRKWLRGFFSMGSMQNPEARP